MAMRAASSHLADSLISFGQSFPGNSNEYLNSPNREWSAQIDICAIVFNTETWRCASTPGRTTKFNFMRAPYVSTEWIATSGQTTSSDDLRRRRWHRTIGRIDNHHTGSA